MLGPTTRLLTQKDVGSKEFFSDLPDLGATTIDNQAFALAYFCNTSIADTYKLPYKKRRILMEMLTEQKNREKAQIEKGRKK